MQFKAGTNCFVLDQYKKFPRLSSDKTIAETTTAIMVTSPPHFDDMSAILTEQSLLLQELKNEREENKNFILHITSRASNTILRANVVTTTILV